MNRTVNQPVNKSVNKEERNTMANPFDNEDGTFHVLVNEENQHCLWPAFAAVPAGWDIVVADSDRQKCLEYIEANWTDMRPASLVAADAA